MMTSRVLEKSNSYWNRYAGRNLLSVDDHLSKSLSQVNKNILTSHSWKNICYLCIFID